MEIYNKINNKLKKKGTIKDVIEYLDNEKYLFEQFIKYHYLIVEIGCMYGNYLPLVYKMDKLYLGVDINCDYINIAMNRVKLLNLNRNKLEFMCENGENVSKILKKSSLVSEYHLNPREIILIFPFNVFGHFKNPKDVIKQLAEMSISFIISTFKTSSFATKIRKTLYMSCGNTNLKIYKEKIGIRIKTSDGFNSVAYNTKWLIDLMSEFGLKVNVYQLCKIGVAYVHIIK